jgi:hypothetical protein
MLLIENRKNLEEPQVSSNFLKKEPERIRRKKQRKGTGKSIP